MVTRTLDFRLTARAVRRRTLPDYKKQDTIFGLNAEGYGRVTWALFWSGWIALLLAVILISFSIAKVYQEKLM